MVGVPLLFIAILVLAECAPRSKSTAATYDQKQTGEYNIQLHLKDFQIIAVLGDDTFPGDYDYNYDYSDFTIKPVTPSTTTKKPDESTIVSSTENTTNTNLTATLPSSILSILSSISSNSSDKLEITNNTTKTPVQPSTTNKPTTADFLSNANITSILTPGQIPVIVQDFSLNSPLILRRNDVSEKKNEAVTNIAIIPSEDGADAQSETPALGEILHYRRCAQGYTRDKRGRCRKIRRQPQMPLGFTRFANTLASRFRNAAAGSSPDLP